MTGMVRIGNVLASPMRPVALLFLASCARTTPPASAPQTALPPAPQRPAAAAAPAKVTAESALARLFTTPDVQDAWLAPVFSAKVSASKLKTMLASLTNGLGSFARVETDGRSYRAIFANGVIPARIHLDDDGRIDGLFFSSPEMSRPRPPSEIARDIAALPGKVSILVTTDGKPVVSHAPDAELAVGSAFKLAILAALKDRVDAKKMAWTQVIFFDDRHRSLPSGILQEWPSGSPLTVHTLASLMMARSDNTATDLLLDTVGRAAVERLAPSVGPFLSTREAFVLKAKRNASLLARWREANQDAKRSLLREVAEAPLPSTDEFDEQTVSALDVEWHIDATRLCRLLEATHTLPMMRINPGLARMADWDEIAFKGGSEPGVLNLSTLVAQGIHRHCIVATWNRDVALDESRLMALYQQMLASVHAGSAAAPQSPSP